MSRNSGRLKALLITEDKININDNFKIEDDIKNEEKLKDEAHLKMKTTSNTRLVVKVFGLPPATEHLLQNPNQPKMPIGST